MLLKEAPFRGLFLVILQFWAESSFLHLELRFLIFGFVIQ